MGTGLDGNNMGALEVGCEVPLSNSVEFRIPITSTLEQNYPNPFNPVTTISYNIAQSGNVQLAIYNLNGKVIEILVNGHKTPGNYSITWNGKKESSGLYLYRLIIGDETITGKMLFIK